MISAHMAVITIMATVKPTVTQSELSAVALLKILA